MLNDLGLVFLITMYLTLCSLGSSPGMLRTMAGFEPSHSSSLAVACARLVLLVLYAVPFCGWLVKMLGIMAGMYQKDSLVAWVSRNNHLQAQHYF